MESKLQRVPLELDDSMPKSPLPDASQVTAGAPSPASAAEARSEPVDVGEIQEKIIAALRTCYDPEIPVNIYEMGLIYDVDVNEWGEVALKMTLTSPACPVAGSLPPEVQAKIAAIPGIKSAKVDVVWDPPWTPERMSEAARLELGMF
jgi:FeS assembly SUF system protein